MVSSGIQMMKAQMPSTPVTGRFFFSLTVTILRLILSIVVECIILTVNNTFIDAGGICT